MVSSASRRYGVRGAHLPSDTLVGFGEEGDGCVVPGAEDIWQGAVDGAEIGYQF